MKLASSGRTIGHDPFLGPESRAERQRGGGVAVHYQHGCTGVLMILMILMVLINPMGASERDK
jgi:hypothetical protein